ncbi:MAG: DNA ligase [Clostridia bacterium]|nr:DNA ligase [Clostridia bacterium]
MSKMSELAAELSELRRCGEILISISETLVQLFSTGAEEPAAQAEPEKTYSFTEVRGILADKSRSGHTVAVKDLLRKYGADKLSDLDPKFYAAIVADVEAL